MTTLMNDEMEKTEADQEQAPNIGNIINIQKYGNYTKLLRITAYVQRFIFNCTQRKNDRRSGTLKPCEMDKATNRYMPQSFQL